MRTEIPEIAPSVSPPVSSRTRKMIATTRAITAPISPIARTPRPYRRIIRPGSIFAPPPATFASRKTSNPTARRAPAVAIAFITQLLLQRLGPRNQFADFLRDVRLPRPVVRPRDVLDEVAGVLGRALHGDAA